MSSIETRPMSFWVRILLFLIFLMPATGCLDRKAEEHPPKNVPQEKSQEKIEDCMARTVRVPQGVGRVVDLAALDGTRTLVTLKAQDKLVGVNSHVANFMYGQEGKKYSCWFAAPKVAPELKDLLNVGDYKEPNTELIRSLDPDVILAYGLSVDFADALEAQTGIPVACIRASGSLDFKMLKVVAAIVGKEDRGKALIAYARKKIEFIRERSRAIPEARRVKVFYWAPPVLGPPRTIAPYDPIDLAGGINLGARAAVKPYETYETTTEQVAVWNPDIILLHWWSRTDIGVKTRSIVEDPVLQTVNAVKKGRVFYSRGFLLGWDPAMGLCEVYYMAKLFYPDRFKDLDVEEEGNEILKQFYGRDGLYTDLLSKSDLHRWTPGSATQ